MSTPVPPPTEIRRLGTDGLRITWKDGHQSEYDTQFLRDHCPCAECRERPRRSLPVIGSQRPRLYPEEISLAGRYAVNIRWSDGHDSGIYSYQTLRHLCPCAQCLAVGTDMRAS
jgi:DUF971 family protein